MTTIDHWVNTWQRLGALVDMRPAYAEVVVRYDEPHRHYHTLRHLDECFRHLAALASEDLHLPELEAAIWLHDVVYDPKRPDNEEQSVAFARALMTRAGVPEAAAGRVIDLILCTTHAVEPEGRDAQVMGDVDLAILGAEPDRFDEFERQIREEYAWVSDVDFRRGRAALLQRLLSRPALFHNPIFLRKYEQRARANIGRTLARLSP